MPLLNRIVENQAALSSYKATQNEDEAVQLELLIEQTKPKNRFFEWHPLIATPFRYSPPHPQARFRPPYGRNVFYGTTHHETALYEHAYHFMKQRKHLAIETETGLRTLFTVKTHDKKATRINHLPEASQLLNPNDYTYSQDFILNHPHHDFIYYPSVRDPEHRENAAVLNIHHLDKKPLTEQTIKFFYDNRSQCLHWLDEKLAIEWNQVNL
ncbi:MAG TPA: RES family NAD+ phosphorylase [Gammaproteobacteria bacterium]|nr:RES family NAD+ phosphorylase [Gammaproteobacteria bacterium]